MAAPDFQNFDYDPILLKTAARHWRSRESRRENNKIQVALGRQEDVETKDRITTHERFQQEARQAEDLFRSVPRPNLALDLFQERVIGDRDFLGVEFLEMAAAVARFVGRIQIRTQPNRIRGYGTGFVVSPRLLLTNNHVLPSAEAARNSLVEFDYQRNRFGEPLPVVVCALEPDTFFITDKQLDFSLVAVSESSVSGPRLSRYAWVRLHPESGKALLGDALNIIQHPRGEMKQLVLRSNKLVDNFEDFVHYETDTDPGSSGSPVFSDFWYVVALHHSGVPKTDAAGNILDIDGRIWRPGSDDPARIAWVGNEGIRVSSLMRAVEKVNLDTPEKRELRRQLFELEPPHPLEIAASNQGTLVNSLVPPGVVTLTIPLNITISLGTPVIPTVQPAGSAAMPASPTPVLVPQVEPAQPTKDKAGGPTPEQEEILRAAQAEFSRLPGVLRVELGYEFQNGWITNQRAIVVTIQKTKKNGKAVAPKLPGEFRELPVQTTTPTVEDLIALSRGQGVAEAVFAEESISLDEITYQAPSGAQLETITDTMRVVAHLSPDAGWPNLEKFLTGARKSITVGMYDFGAKHILDALLKLRSKPSFKKLTLVMQKGESVGEGTKANDLHDNEVVERLTDGFGQKFRFAWVKIGRVNGWVASSYHIKVAVRDGKAFWLSSGNWQSSNQPPANPLTQTPQKKDWLNRYNREWHAIVEHRGLAQTLETFLLNDHDSNDNTDGRDEFMLPDVLVPEEFFTREAAEAPDSWKYFEPFNQKRQFTVTPLLTPDNYHNKVQELVCSAQQELLLQNQTFNAPKENHDKLRELVEAVLEKQRTGVNVRIIFRLLDQQPSAARRNLSALKDMGFSMDFIRVQRNCHTKGIIVDGKQVLLGSQNWSNDGVSVNRDASLLFDDEELAAYFKKVFEHDWLALADQDIGPEDQGIELAASPDVTPKGMVRLTWKDYMETL